MTLSVPVWAKWTPPAAGLRHCLPSSRPLDSSLPSCWTLQVGTPKAAALVQRLGQTVPHPLSLVPQLTLGGRDRFVAAVSWESGESGYPFLQSLQQRKKFVTQRTDPLI